MQKELFDQLHSFYRELISFAPILVKAIIFLFVGFWISNRIDKWLKAYFDRRDFDVSLKGFLSSLINIGLKVFVVITFSGMIGLPSASLFAIFGAAGLAIGLAIQGSLSNFAGGVLILIYKPFKIGDKITAQGETGVVQEIQIFNTILLTAENNTVVLPNGAVSNSKIINITRHGNLRIELKLTVEFEVDLEKVKGLIMEVLLSDKRVLKDLSPTVKILEFGDQSIQLIVRFYALNSDSSDVFFDSYEKIRLAFIENGIRTTSLKKITL